MDAANDEIEKNKKLASFQREVAIATKKIVMDEMSHASRWIMASVLAINSGGLIASISKVSSLEGWATSAFVAFYCGVFLALSMGWTSMSLSQRLLSPNSKLIVFWEMAAIDGDFEAQELEVFRDELLAAGSKTIMLRTIGYWSFVLFTAGLLCLAMSFKNHDTPTQSQTMAHQK